MHCTSGRYRHGGACIVHWGFYIGFPFTFSLDFEIWYNIRLIVVSIDNQNSFIILREYWFLRNNEFFKKLKQTRKPIPIKRSKWLNASNVMTALAEEVTQRTINEKLNFDVCFFKNGLFFLNVRFVRIFFKFTDCTDFLYGLYGFVLKMYGFFQKTFCPPWKFPALNNFFYCNITTFRKQGCPGLHKIALSIKLLPLIIEIRKYLWCLLNFYSCFMSYHFASTWKMLNQICFNFLSRLRKLLMEGRRRMEIRIKPLAHLD